MVMDLKIKEISANETYEIRHKVMWPDESLDFVILENDEKGFHYGLIENTELVSVISVFIVDNSLQFRKFATLVSKQGNGYGSILLEFIITTFCSENSIERIWCNARVDKASFYEKFGFIKTENIFCKCGIDYVIMEKNAC